MQEIICVDALYDRFLHKNKKDEEIIECINQILSFPVASLDTLCDRKKKIQGYKEKLNELLTRPKIEQKSKEWFDMRYNMITASDMGQSLGEGKFGSVNQIYKKKCGYEEETFNHYIPPLKWGCMFEQVAADIYMKRRDIKLHDFGILQHPVISHFGASPDGITEQGIMLEIKCPFKRKITGEIPSQYFYQIQGQLEVCDLDECDYLECGFKLYQDVEEFKKDRAYPFERGIIIEYGEKKDNVNVQPVYVYSPISSMLDKYDLEQWLDREKPKWETYENFAVHFWKLDVFSVVRVYRDKEFIRGKLTDLGDVWKKIVDYRNNKDLYVSEISTTKRSRKTTQQEEVKPPPPAAMDFRFRDTDDD